MRSAWTGHLSLGLINIPIKLYLATEENDVSFHQLHDACGTPIRQAKTCPTCEVSLETSDIVRGFPIEGDKNNCVVFTDEDMENLPLSTSKSVEVLGTTEMPDPIRISKNYYVSPNKGGEHAYSVLINAMKSRRKNGVISGLVSLRSRERPCAIWLRDKTMVLSVLRYADEVREFTYDIGRVERDEIDLANKILDLTSKSAPSNNRYKDAIIEMANKKLKGEKIKPAPKPNIEVTDLREALKAQLAALSSD